ncbi:MAG: thioredoxin domain-containing protein [Candidatus Aenigmarchaeota archaeon]|nr:thioredoxin domain-containing protein [Candidatus Aenigmarchaeota archaeon]
MEKPVCHDCSRQFDSREALEQHRNAKHAQPAAAAKKTFSPKPVHVAVVLGVGVLVVVLYFLMSPGARYEPKTADADNFLGTEAAVTVTEYSDFQCPACGAFFRQTEPQFIAAYVETGKVKFVYKHFPLTSTHAYAQKAAEAAECAADQGKFWEYHNKLFENQQALYLAALKGYAASLGLDTDAFNQCLDSGVMASRVKADADEALKRGVKATPTLYVNNVKVEGAQSFSSMRNIIDTELAKT